MFRERGHWLHKVNEIRVGHDEVVYQDARVCIQSSVVDLRDHRKRQGGKKEKVTSWYSTKCNTQEQHGTQYNGST